MSVIATRIDPASPEFAENAARMREQVDELRAQLAGVRTGSEAAVERHRARGKLTARERIDLLLDPDSAWLELSPLAAHGIYDGDAPAAGHRDRHRHRARPRSA